VPNGKPEDEENLGTGERGKMKRFTPLSFRRDRKGARPSGSISSGDSRLKPNYLDGDGASQYILAD
jgi:hypothetical protein